MKSIITFIRKKSIIHYLLLILGVAVWCCALAVAAEGISQPSDADLQTFLAGEKGIALLRNIALLASLLALALTFLCRSLTAGAAVAGLLLYVPPMINAFKLQFRSEPFFPWDLSLAGEVGNIMSDLDFVVTPWMLAGGGLLLLGLIGGFLADLFWLKRFRRPYWKELIAGLALAVLLCCSGHLLLREDYLQEKDVTIINWNQSKSYRDNGFFYAFIANYQRAQVNAPEGYSQAAIDGITETVSADTGALAEAPNVIVIMSEAFSDIWNAGALEFDRKVAPNFTALAKQYLSGRVMTSEFGGGTANSEFEVLTGYSTYQLPAGTIAYMNYVDADTDSYVSYLNEQNYTTVALHPYLRNYFSRDTAYEEMGFDAFYSEESFEGAERIRTSNYVSDQALTERIIEEYEKNESTGNPFFCHTVSMQNHASFYTDELPEEQRIGMTSSAELTKEEFGAIRTYASLLSITDQALGELVAYFEQVEEPTVIVFFGDHQPSFGSKEVQQRIGYATGSAEEITYLEQSTPYLIWNNFQETPTHAEEDLSMFHLLPYMTRNLSMERPLFHAYMDTVFDACKGLTRQIALTADGKPVRTLPEKEQTKIEEYQMIVYDSLLGNHYGNPTLY